VREKGGGVVNKKPHVLSGIKSRADKQTRWSSGFDPNRGRVR